MLEVLSSVKNHSGAYLVLLVHNKTYPKVVIRQRNLSNYCSVDSEANLMLVVHEKTYLISIVLQGPLINVENHGGVLGQLVVHGGTHLTLIIQHLKFTTNGTHLMLAIIAD